MDAVILAAGEGTRMRPLTSTRPKPMLPVSGKPILEWDLQALKENGFKKVFLVVGYEKEEIINYFGRSYEGLEIEYVTQQDQLGTGHAVYAVKDQLESKEFLVMNGDLLISKAFIKEFLEKSDRSPNSIALLEVDNPSEFGILQLRGDNTVESLIEKPKEPESNLANAGIYLFDEQVFNAIEKIQESTRAEYELTDAIKILAEDEVYGYAVEKTWIDVGRPWDLLEANRMMMNKIELTAHEHSVIEENVVMKGKIEIGKGTIIKSGAYIEGPVRIGQDCVIGPNCYIRAHTSLADNVKIGNAVEIKNSLIMGHTNICHLSYLGDSIIGENCNFGAGTKVANLRIDNQEVQIEIKNKLTSSGRKKFGCIMGDGVKTGINVSILPGRAIYPHAYVEAGSVVRNTIY